MSKYLSLYQEMKEVHKDLFAQFAKVHKKYSENQKKHQNEFNNIGLKVQETVRAYEKQLCGKTDSSSYSRFAANLSDKFWKEVKKEYPLIDFVGVEVS